MTVWWTPSFAMRPVNELLESLVNHRGAPTCVETHVKTSIESVRTVYRLLLTAWTHAEQAHGDRSLALCAMWSEQAGQPCRDALVCTWELQPPGLINIIIN